MEASIASGDPREALRWAKRYAEDSGADAFELASTLRQLKEVWQLAATDPVAAVVPVLEYQLLQKEGGRTRLSAASMDCGGFEAVYGNEGLARLHWLETLFARARSIARVEDFDTGERHGTGFLIAGSSLCSSWDESPVFITNSHVISDAPANEAPLRPGQGVAEFTRVEGTPRVRLRELIATSPKFELDFSAFSIESADWMECLQLTRYRPSVPKDDETQRIYVMGHPKGDELSVSLYDNNLARYEAPYVHYRSPTEGGNSGSPVFNRRLDTFAIHHRARDDLQLNEGVLTEAIKSKLQSVGIARGRLRV